MQDYQLLAERNMEPDVVLGDDLVGVARQMEAAGPAFTIWDHKTPILCAGAIVIWTGTAQMWMLANGDIPARTRARAIVEVGQSLFQLGTERHRLTCVMAYVRVGYGAVAFLKRMAFQRVGLISHYMPNDDDVVLWVWNKTNGPCGRSSRTTT